MKSPLSLLALLALITLAACGGPATEEEPEPERTPSYMLKGLAALDAWIEEHPVDKSNKDWRLSLLSPVWDYELDHDKRYVWTLETNRGTMKFELFGDRTPVHVRSTAFLTRIGFYDGGSFHRVISRFMAQGGCPRGDGRGGPGYELNGEFHPALRHSERGILSTANSGPGTDGSQFFILFGPSPNLDNKHTVFGKMLEGEEALKRIERLGSDTGKTRSAVRIEKATIEEMPRSSEEG